MNNHTLGYAILCIVVPVAWGLVVYRVSAAIDKRAGRQARAKAVTVESKSEGTVMPLDYHI